MILTIKTFSIILMTAMVSIFHFKGECRSGNIIDTHLYNKARISDLRRNFKKSVRIYTGLIKSFPDYHELYYRRGLANMELGHLKEAISDFDEAIRLNPKYAEAYNKRGLAKWDLSLYNEALEDNLQSIKLNPGEFESYYNRGLTYEKLNSQQSAIADYSITISLNPYHIHAYLKRGNIYLMQKEIDIAKKDFEKASQLDPYNPLIFKFKALAEIECGDFQSAEKSLMEAIELDYLKYYGNDIKPLLKLCESNKKKRETYPEDQKLLENYGRLLYPY